MDKQNIELSKYAQGLDLLVRTRYTQKISVIGLDPYLKQPALQKLDSECLPPVDALNVVSFLVLQTSFYTKNNLTIIKAWMHIIKF